MSSIIPKEIIKIMYTMVKYGETAQSDRSVRITKTCLFKYTEQFYLFKYTEQFSEKKTLIFFIFLLKT